MAFPVAGRFVLYTGQQWAVILIALAIGIALKVLVVTWILRDVRRTGRPTRPWLIAAILVDLPTLIVWLIVRPKRARAPVVRAAPPPEPFAGPSSVEAPRAYRVAQAPAAPPEPAPTPGPESAASSQMVRIACPRCGERFVAQKAAQGPTSVTCPNCGASGRV